MGLFSTFLVETSKARTCECDRDYFRRVIRYRMITREEAIRIVRVHDIKFSLRERFCDFCGYLRSEFGKIADGLFYRDLFIKNNNGAWHFKNPIWEQ